MTYYNDVYKKRGNWWGATSKDQYLNIAKKYFEDYLLNSPNADSIVLGSLPLTAAIHENSQDDSKMTKYFLIGLENEVNVGDLIAWYGDNWLVLRKEKRTLEAYHKVLAVRCNFNLKWIDAYGILNQKACFLFSSLESKIQDNFRTWNGLLIPQANKFLEIILPFSNIPKGQRFIINNEGWRTVEKDLTSVNGILYMSLVEDKVDSYDDDAVNGIANSGELNSSYIDLGITNLTIAVGESFTFNPILYQNDKVVEGAQFIYSSSTGNYFTFVNSTLTAASVGSSVFYVSLADQPTLIAQCTINVQSAAPTTGVLQIVGDENIKWGKLRTYNVFYHDGGTPSSIAATFVLENADNLVTMTTTTNSCSLLANNTGKTGIITLRATTEYGEITKDISVVSLW